jgi:2,3-bisphosphoglycerate-dependent phosphoglycerate mutase
MTRDYASLHRRPFLTPIWLTVLGAVCAFAFLSFAVWLWGTADSTTIVVVRHAEKELNAGADPPLSPEGQARAALLARMFADPDGSGRLDAIYVSPTMRNRMTAAPVAALLGLTPVEAPNSDSPALANRVLKDHRGGRVLVIGHSDTVNEIVEALSGVSALPPIQDDQYGIMYIVSVPRIGRANLLRVNY